ncbi:PilZ domain-containing protein [Thiohalobacter sp. IOR34]|uniref:PilZ domain-containing protein n=1 Tax=Thiohalobacter sp. IOR34 TaxID=3057176 RepID=UPI0025B27A20|nr:PilZ domain-containing protein [Thiohalobacter sp. IOR34]WJW74262.1 PilZ domain-containing protein [Thiohalobacter sp. IOR34]
MRQRPTPRAVHALADHSRGIVMERRRSPRTRVDIEVELRDPAGEYRGIACDISQTGLYVEFGEGARPASREALQIKFSIWTGSQLLTRQTRGHVVRSTDSGLAIRFSDEDMVSQAVVNELIHYMTGNAAAGSSLGDSLFADSTTPA